MIVAEKAKYSVNDEGNVEVTFIVSGYNNKRIAQRLIANLKGKQIEFNAKELKSKRSVEQNDMFWALVAKISDKVNGSHREEDMMRTYGYLLKEANIKRDYVRILEVAKHILEDTFRAVVEVQNSRRTEPNGSETVGYWVYHGSSTFNVKEMNELIDLALDTCTDLGIDDQDIETIRRDHK